MQIFLKKSLNQTLNLEKMWFQCFFLKLMSIYYTNTVFGKLETIALLFHLRKLKEQNEDYVDYIEDQEG